MSGSSLQNSSLWALVPCAGSGSRAGGGTPKQYRQVADRSVVAWSLDALGKVVEPARTVVVIAAGDDGFGRAAPEFTGTVAAVGGSTRADSVRQGLAELRRQGAGDGDWVLVHDAARCLVRPEWIESLVTACQGDDVGGLLAHPLQDTLKEAVNGRSAATVSRNGKWLAQTPQMFRLALLERALDAARAEGQEITDEASAVERLGLAPVLVACSTSNFKLTYPEDFERAQALLATRGERAARREPPPAPSLRIGQGWDVHRLVAGRKLLLGGVAIPFERGLFGHSDADVLLHAITDAVLGAAGLGDIGRHFPDTDERFRGADSSMLLREALRRVQDEGWQLLNLDATVVAQAPKLAPHMAAIRASVAAVLACGEGQVNIKAKTAEKLGPVGQGEAIEASAACLLYR